MYLMLFAPQQILYAQPYSIKQRSDRQRLAQELCSNQAVMSHFCLAALWHDLRLEECDRHDWIMSKR